MLRNVALVVYRNGRIDFPNIIKIAKENVMKYFIVKHERYDNNTSLQCVEADTEFMRKLKI
jgi:hypothetical protein